MDLEAICWFVEVVNRGSFTGAAEHLRLPTSNLSRRIAKLEQQLDCKLLMRSTRALALTDEGQDFLPLAQKLCANAQLIDHWALSRAQVATGTLRITAPAGFAKWPLADWLIDYQRKFKQVKIELINSNQYLDFQQHQLDFAFRQGPLVDSSLISQLLFKIEYGVFATPQLLAEIGAINNLQDLQGKPLIATSANASALPWVFAENNFKINKSQLMFEDTSLCLKAAVAGLGISYLSWYEAGPLVKQGKLVSLLEHLKPTAMGFYLMYSNREFKPKKNQEFLRLVDTQSAQFDQLQGIIFERGL